jgi:hypothetical protein
MSNVTLDERILLPDLALREGESNDFGLRMQAARMAKLLKAIGDTVELEGEMWQITETIAVDRVLMTKVRSRRQSTLSVSGLWSPSRPDVIIVCHKYKRGQKSYTRMYALLLQGLTRIQGYYY